jgi:Tfp pilus assembly protein PilE
MTANRSRSRAFLIELVACILIFALCALVALQIFAVAHSTSNTAAALSTLSIKAQNVAETFKANKGDTRALSRELGMVGQPDGSLVLGFDANLNPSQAVGHVPYLVICSAPQKSNGASTTEVTVWGNGDTLEHFPVSAALGVKP